MKILRNLVALLVIGFAGLAVAAPRPVVASRWVELGEANLRLLMEAPQAGDTQIRAGLEIRLAENFKTYWRNAGDSGVPPQADFSKSSGLGDSRIEFPFPLRFDDGAGGIAFGYTKSVILPIFAKREGNSPLRLHVKLDFAVCGTMCIPLGAELELNPEGAAAEQPAALEAARQRVPVRLNEADARARIAVQRLAAGSKPRWRVLLSPDLEAASAMIFLEANGYLSPGQGTAAADGRLSFEVTGEASPGSGGMFGPARLTFGDGKLAFDAMIDLDGAPQAP